MKKKILSKTDIVRAMKHTKSNMAAARFLGCSYPHNEWNEKNVVGFIAFLVMVAFALLDLTTGYLGKDLVINETEEVDYL